MSLPDFVFAIRSPSAASQTGYYSSLDKLVRAVVEGTGADWRTPAHFGSCALVFYGPHPAIDLTHACAGAYVPVHQLEQAAYEYANQAHVSKMTKGSLPGPTGSDPKKTLTKARAEARRAVRADIEEFLRFHGLDPIIFDLA